MHKSLLSAIACCALLAPAAGNAADRHDITFDASVDFRALRTFAIRDGQIASEKLEINNRLFRQRMEDGIRAALVKKGLTEVASGPDVWVTYSFSDRDVSTVDRLPPAAGGTSPVLYTEGTLVIDLTNASNSLLWRGTWRDQEQNGPRLSRKLSEDARKLLSRYPPKRR